MKQEKTSIQLPLVSVAIITYNQCAFLKEALDSVLVQDYPNYEIIIADDASCDGTEALLRDYAQKNQGIIRYKIAKSNLGITKNANVAFRMCQGQYIAWLGGDDLMFPGKLKKQVTLMESKENCAICYHNLEVFNSDTGVILGLYNNRWNSVEGDYRIYLKYYCPTGGSSVMVRRSSCPTDGFNEKVSIASDWLFFIETAINGGDICYINEVLGRYRKHQNNITSKNRGDFTDVWLSLAILMYKYPHLSPRLHLGVSMVYYCMGFYYFNNKNDRLAFRFFWCSIQSNVTYWKSWIRLFQLILRFVFGDDDDAE